MDVRCFLGGGLCFLLLFFVVFFVVVVLCVCVFLLLLFLFVLFFQLHLGGIFGTSKHLFQKYDVIASNLKVRLDISSELSPKQIIRLKYQAQFSGKIRKMFQTSVCRYHSYIDSVIIEYSSDVSHL